MHSTNQQRRKEKTKSDSTNQQRRKGRVKPIYNQSPATKEQSLQGLVKQRFAQKLINYIIASR